MEPDPYSTFCEAILPNSVPSALMRPIMVTLTSSRGSVGRSLALRDHGTSSSSVVAGYASGAVRHVSDRCGRHTGDPGMCVVTRSSVSIHGRTIFSLSSSVVLTSSGISRTSRLSQTPPQATCWRSNSACSQGGRYSHGVGVRRTMARTDQTSRRSGAGDAKGLSAWL